MLHMVHVAVVVALLLAVASSSPCPNATDWTSMIDNNRDYVWRDCRTTTGATPWTITAANGAQPLTNVYLHVSGGAALPLFDLSNVPSLVNVSIHVEGYVQTPTSLPIARPFVVLPLNCMDVQIVLLSCQFVFDGATSSQTLESGLLSFITHQMLDAFMSNVSITIHSCTIQLVLANHQSLVEFHLANNSNGVRVVLADSTIAVTTSGVYVYVIHLANVRSLLPPFVCTSPTDIRLGAVRILRAVSFHLQRSTIEFTQDCTDPMSLCGNSVDPFDARLQSSECAFMFWEVPNMAIHEADLVISDVVFQSTLLLPVVESDATRVSRSMTMLKIWGRVECRCSLPRLTFLASNVTACMASGQGVSLFGVAQVDELSDAALVIQDSHFSFYLHGALNSDAYARSATLIRINNETVGPNVTIQLKSVVTFLTLLSGEQLPSALASSPLSLTYAALVHITATIKQRLSSPSIAVTVVLRDCQTRTEISNGSLPLYHHSAVDKYIRSGLQWPAMAAYTMMSTLVFFDPQHAIASVSASIINCSLRSSAGLSMAVVPTLASATVTSAISLMTVSAICTRSFFTILDSFVEVTSLSFPKQSPQLSTIAIQQRSALDASSGFLFLNITSLFQASDVVSLGSYAMNKALSASFPFAISLMKQQLSTMYAPTIVYDRVEISIQHSTILYPSEYKRYPADILAFVLTPTIANNTSIVVLASPSLSPVVAQMNRPTVVGILTSELQNCSVSVTGVTDAGPMIVAWLGRSLIGDGTVFHFTNNSFHGEAVNGMLYGVTAFGVNASFLIVDVPSTRAVLFIADNRFDGFTKVFDEKQLMFQTLQIESEGFVPPVATPPITLGCNLWQGAPLPPSAVGIGDNDHHTNAGSWSSLRQLVQYPPSYYFNHHSLKVFCKGLITSRSITTPLDFASSASSRRTGSNVAASVAAGMVCMSYVFPQMAVSIATLQRSLQALSLARRCTAAGADAPDDFMADWMSNPLQMHFSSADDGLGWAAGSVVGNVLMIAFLTVVRWLWSSAVAARRSSWSLPVREALRSGFHACGGWVSSYRDAYIALLQPLATAATALAVVPAEAGFTGTPLTYALSVFGLVVVFAPTVRWAWVVLMLWSSRFPFVQIKRTPVTKTRTITDSRFSFAEVPALMVALKQKKLVDLSAAVVWRPVSRLTLSDQGTVHPADALPYLPIFDELLIARHWYFVVDFAFCVASGVVAGAASFSDKCAWGEWLLVGVSLLNLVVVGVLRPYRSAFSGWCVLVNLTLGFTVAILAALTYNGAASAIVTALAIVAITPTAVSTAIKTQVSVGRQERSGTDTVLSSWASVPAVAARKNDVRHRDGVSLSSRSDSSVMPDNLVMLVRMACQESREKNLI